MILRIDGVQVPIFFIHLHLTFIGVIVGVHCCIFVRFKFSKYGICFIQGNLKLYFAWTIQHNNHQSRQSSKQTIIQVNNCPCDNRLSWQLSPLSRLSYLCRCCPLKGSCGTILIGQDTVSARTPVGWFWHFWLEPVDRPLPLCRLQDKMILDCRALAWCGDKTLDSLISSTGVRILIILHQV